MHKNYESLFEHVPREMVPRELEGGGPSLVELIGTGALVN